MKSRLFFMLWAIAAAWAMCQPAQAAKLGSSWVLTRDEPSVELQGEVDAWVDSSDRAGIQEVATAETLFLPHRLGEFFALGEDKSVWIRLRVRRMPGESDHWILNIPVTYLDSVSLYQRDPNGVWREQVSGDAIAHNAWSRSGFTTAFSLQLDGNSVQELYLRVRNRAPDIVPMRISTENVHDRMQSFETLAIGLMLGVLAAFAGLSLVRYAQYRVPPDLAAAAYAVLVLLTVAQNNGVLNATLWQSLPLIANHINRVMGPLTVGCSLLYMRELYALSIHYHRFDRLLGSVGLASIVLSLGILVVESNVSRQLGAINYLVATVAALAGAVLSWRAGSPIRVWLMLATAPQALTLVWLAAETLALVQPLWEIRFLTSLLQTLSVPILAYALSILTHDRKEREQRTLHLDTQDALTGLLTPAAFDIQLRDALHRVNEHREPVALVLVNLVNYSQIVSHFGQSMAEQCELRAVVKLHRVLRDVDPAGRIGAGKFALLLEGVKSRDRLNERVVKLIASGLIPQAGLEPQVPLQFHAACVLLHERPLQVDSALDTLLELVSTISPGTRRPIRFVEAVETVPFDTGEPASSQQT